MRAVLYLALNTNEQTKIGVEKLSEELNIPKHFLAKILQILTKNKIVSSSKGKNGGFYLSDSEKSLKLMSVITTIDGPDRLTGCIIGLDQCSNSNPCPYHESVLVFRQQFYKQLMTETIGETADRINLDQLSLFNN